MFRKLISFVLLLSCFLTVSGQTAGDSITLANFQWEETTMGKGITHKHGTFTDLYGGAQNVNILVIDLKKKAYKTKIAVTVPNQITSETAIANHAVAAINGSYYDENVTFKSTCYIKFGKNVIDTTKASELDRVTGAIVIKKGKVKLIPWNKEIELAYKDNKGEVMSSGPLMIYKGKTCDFSTLDKKFIETKHPRSAIAFINPKTMLLITVDGRFPKQAEGMSIPELTHMLKVLGCKDALNLDGGRSTTLWSNAAPENGVLNKPAANKIFDSYGERKNANTIVIIDK